MVAVSYTDDPVRMRKTVKIIKDFAANPDLNIDQYAKEENITRHVIYERIYDFVALYERTVDEDDFPNRLLQFYRFLKGEDALTADEIKGARYLVRLYHPKHKSQTKEESYSETSINNIRKPNPTAYPDPFISGNGGQEPQQPQQPQQEPQTDTYEGLVRNITENIPYIQAYRLFPEGKTPIQVAIELGLRAISKLSFYR